MRGEDRLEEALRSVGDEYLRRNPADLHRARERVHRLRRRRQMRAGVVAALGAAAAAAVAVFVWPATDVARDRPRPAAPVELPEGTIEIEVGDNPTEVAVGEGAVWVSNADDASVTRIDPGGNAPVPVNFTGTPGDLAVGDGGEVWVANTDLGAVQRIDPVTNAITPDVRIEVAAPEEPLDLAIDEFLWVAVVGRELVQVDKTTGETVRHIRSVRPVNVAARDGAVFVLESDGTVQGIDPATGEPNAIELSLELSGRGDIHFQDDKLWVAEGNGSTLYYVDVAAVSGRVATATFRGTYLEMVHVPEGVVVLSDVGDGTGVLTLIDPEGGETTELAQIPGSPRDLVHGDGDLWVSLSATDRIARLPSLP